MPATPCTIEGVPTDIGYPDTCCPHKHSYPASTSGTRAVYARQLHAMVSTKSHRIVLAPWSHGQGAHQ
eukprot:4954642-Alexandrium_andersonii.AAC.1